jgi:hypothetical protein
VLANIDQSVDPDKLIVYVRITAYFLKQNLTKYLLEEHQSSPDVGPSPTSRIEAVRPRDKL